MAFGRAWIDNNILSHPGHHTYADEIYKAYNEDHPNKQLTFTNVSTLLF